MNYNNYIGIDISKGKLDLAVLNQEGELILYQCLNDKKSIIKCLGEIFKESNLSKEDTLIIAESSGHYINPLIWSIIAENYLLWIEDGYQIANSQGIRRGKNDEKDAEMIAIYGKRFSDRCQLVEASSECIENLAYLNSERELLTKEMVKYDQQLTDHKEYVKPSFYLSRKKRYTELIANLKTHISEIEQEMEKLIENDPKLSHYAKLLRSIPGIGKQVSIATIIATKGFTKFTDPRKFACHVGVVPFEYKSGSSIRSAHKISQRANKKMKSLFHLASLVVIQLEGEFKDYYLRKQTENKMSIINAIRGKLIHIVFAVIKRNEPYTKEFKPSFQNCTN
ncbi:IS110 family transposase (plasmid) [Flammeovirga pectinis]|uniref:IS110 family transposase n=1 Tax=Flammeovirga pectinis TaxID=2494373 RepID=A0A3S9PBL4_9BACT|nr:transposase [Flammeovirga pectinis]AZQ65615.1 IS110 family transposase [Flammeovirga pectinis]